MRPTTSRPVTSRIGNTANIAARLGPVRVPVRAPFVGNGRPGAANVPRVLGPRGTNVNNAENAQNAQNPPVRQPVRQPEQDQRTTLTGAGTWEYQTPACFSPSLLPYGPMDGLRSRCPSLLRSSGALFCRHRGDIFGVRLERHFCLLLHELEFFYLIYFFILLSYIVMLDNL